MNDPADWSEWIALYPPPSIQQLVADHGGLYRNIPDEAWADWDQRVTEWETTRRDRLLGSHSWANMKSKK